MEACEHPVIPIGTRLFIAWRHPHSNRANPVTLRTSTTSTARSNAVFCLARQLTVAVNDHLAFGANPRLLETHKVTVLCLHGPAVIDESRAGARVTPTTGSTFYPLEIHVVVTSWSCHVVGSLAHRISVRGLWGAPSRQPTLDVTVMATLAQSCSAVA